MATTISRLEVELVLDDKNFQVKIRGSKVALEAFTKAVGKADTKAKRHEKTVRKLGTSFRHTVVTLGLLKDAMRTAWRMSGGLLQGIVDVTAEFERLNVLLKGMSSGVTEIEKAADAAKQFQQVIELAKSAPFTVQELTRSWVKFRSVGIDPSTGALKALVDAVAAFGGTSDILQRASIAVQQMAGKGVISMEELRQQMGEAVPQAMVLLARGMNLSVNDMVTAISKGAVLARPALQKMFAEFDLTFGGAAIDLMDTYIGSLARLTTVWQLTLKEIGEASGLFETVKEEVKLLIVQLDDPAVRRFGIDIGLGMTKAFQLLVSAVRESVKWLNEHAAMVWKVIAAWGAFKAMGIIQFLLSTSRAVSGLTKVVGFLGTIAMARMGVQTANAAKATKGLAKVFKNLIGIITKMGWIGWIGILLSVAAAVWGWLKASESLNKSQETGIELVEKYGEAASKFSKEQALLEIQALEDTLQKHETLVNGSREALKVLFKLGRTEGTEAIIRSIAVEDAAMAVQREKQRRLKKMVTDAIEGAARRSAENQRRDMMAIFRKGLEEARNATRDEDAKINERFKDELIDEDQRLEIRQTLWKAFLLDQTKFAEEETNRQHAIINEAENLLSINNKNIDISTWKFKIEEAKKAIKEIAEVLRLEHARISKDLAIMFKATELVDESSRNLDTWSASLDKMLINAIGKIASLKAELFDGMKKLEAFQAKVDAGLFGDKAGWTDKMIKAAILLEIAFASIDRISDEVAEKKSFDSAMKAAKKTLAAATEEALIFAEAVDAGLNEVTGKRGRRFRTMMAGIVALYREGTIRANELLVIQKQLMDAASDIDTNKKILAIRQELEELQVSGIQNARERFETEQELFDIQVQAFLVENAQADNIIQLRNLYAELREQKKKLFEDRTPMNRLLKDWEDTMGAMENAQASWMNSFVDTIVDGLEEGKIEFEEFAKAILKDLLKILLRALIVRAVLSMFGGGTDKAPPIELDLFKDAFVPTFGKGGIMSSSGAVQQYARGGIATKPQIAIFGEGGMNEAFVPLPDGRSIPVSITGSGKSSPPDVTVNVINETGIPLDAEQQGGLEFDGEGFVLDVVLKAANRPGGFRDGLRSATG